MAQTNIGPGHDPPDVEAGGRLREPEILMAFDDVGQRVLIERLGEISGASYRLLDALRASFRSAREAELHPESFPFLRSQALADELSIDETSLRKRVSRLRKEEIAQLCAAVGRPALQEDAIVENLPWRGYRLNPFRVRLVALSEIKKRALQL